MLEEEILLAKGKNWARLVMQRADEIADTKKNNVDLMIQMLSGQIWNEAVNEIAFEIKHGYYDSMLMPKEYNL